MVSTSKHIVILTSQHLVANPRVWKEANTLYKHGYRVTILTTWYSLEKLHADQELLSIGINYHASVNLIPKMGSFTDRFWGRAIMKMAYLLKHYFKIDTEYILHYRPRKQLRVALSIPADLYIAHQESGMLTGCKLINLGKKVAFDFEDWYSEDYINTDRPTKFLKQKENIALKKACYVTCPSETMQQALKINYQIESVIQVIYNSFPENKHTLQQDQTKKKNTLVWFSQVIGPGRGLEKIITAINYLTVPIELHLLGLITHDYEIKLKSLLKSKHQIFIHKPISHQSLHLFLSSFSIGLAIEETFPESRNTTVTNKILQYTQAGIKVIATPTKGQKEIAEKLKKTITILHPNDLKKWAETIHQLINSELKIDTNELTLFSTFFSWEAQEKKILDLVSDVFQP